MARVVIFIEHPPKVTSGETESWLEQEVEVLGGEGVDRVRLTRLRAASSHFSDPYAWMVELDCRSAEAACDALRDGPGLALLGDLRLLGMRPSVALVEDVD